MLGRVAGYLMDPPRWAIKAHRRAHRLWLRGDRAWALLLCTWARVLTAIEIHPAATIGEGFEIRHGMGTVVGEAVVIGDGCVLSHGVTLGAKEAPRPGQPPENPRLGNGVYIGAGAAVLGPVTIGDDARIGALAVVLLDVPAGWTAVGNPARILPPKVNTTTAEPR